MVTNQNIAGLPNWDQTIAMSLQVISEKDSWKRNDLQKTVADRFNLTDEARNRSYPNAPDKPIVESRIGWTLSDLAIAGLISRPHRGEYQITSLGRQMLSKYGDHLTRNQVYQLPMFQEHQKEVEERRARKVTTSQTSQSTTGDPEDIFNLLAQKTKDYNIEVTTKLRQQIIDSDPVFFEHLVVKLLSRMGYKGPNGSATVTPISNDGGIDGIINQDPLGTSTVYLQAKRYSKDNTVQRPQIQSFYGALQGKGAQRGVFITTSRFSPSAADYARRFSIVLIDGLTLTDLMLEYEVGVQVKHDYKLYEIDDDFFNLD
ncbi:MAG: restriction endonuclease [Lentilactobacillus diolivorans]|uniref:restriction endonuclease n=1 Tax=Lentilactobacillus diolivorans TaxID=179838 RepID=UPI0039EA1F5E